MCTSFPKFFLLFRFSDLPIIAHLFIQYVFPCLSGSALKKKKKKKTDCPDSAELSFQNSNLSFITHRACELKTGLVNAWGFKQTQVPSEPYLSGKPQTSAFWVTALCSVFEHWVTLLRATARTGETELQTLWGATQFRQLQGSVCCHLVLIHHLLRPGTSAGFLLSMTLMKKMRCEIISGSEDPNWF